MMTSVGSYVSVAPGDWKKGEVWRIGAGKLAKEAERQCQGCRLIGISDDGRVLATVHQANASQYEVTVSLTGEVGGGAVTFGEGSAVPRSWRCSSAAAAPPRLRSSRRALRGPLPCHRVALDRRGGALRYTTPSAPGPARFAGVVGRC